MKTFGNHKGNAAKCDVLLSGGTDLENAISSLVLAGMETPERAKNKFLGHIAYLKKNQLADVRIKTVGGRKIYRAHVLPHLAGVSSIENVSIAAHPAVSAALSEQSETVVNRSTFCRSASVTNTTIDSLLSGGCRFSDLVNTLIADHGLSRPKAAGKAKARIRELGAVEHRGFYRVD